MDIIFKGKVNDLLHVSDDNVIKMTRLVKVTPNTDPEKDEVLDITFTSSDPSGNHNIFNQFINKDITVVICTEDNYNEVLGLSHAIISLR